jgi:hypothetical protein
VAISGVGVGVKVGTGGGIGVAPVEQPNKENNRIMNNSIPKE